MNHEALNRLHREQAARGRPSAEEQEALGKIDAQHEANRLNTVNRLAMENFGVSGHDSDGTFTAHPVMSGIIRRTLREAYDAGRNETAQVMVDALLHRLVETPEPKDPSP